VALSVCCLQLLIQEHQYWMSAPKLVLARAANGSSDTVYNMSRYHAEWDLPRPESYKCARDVLQ
jgi:hypothetical protein